MSVIYDRAKDFRRNWSVSGPTFTLPPEALGLQSCLPKMEPPPTRLTVTHIDRERGVITVEAR